MANKILDSFEVAPKTGRAIELKQGQYLKIIDIEGEQVVDLTAFSITDAGVWLSSGRSIDYNGTIYLTTGHILYSNSSAPMLQIAEDTAGRHDFIFTPCSQQMFEIQYDAKEPHPNCLDNLSGSLHPYGIAKTQIPTPFNIFMNIEFAHDGSYKIHPPSSKAGDHIIFKAEMDLVIAVSACSAGAANNHSFSPVGVETFAS